MKKITMYLLPLCISLLSMHAHAQTTSHDYAFMTTRDIRNNDLSNVTITNQTGQPITTNGLYIVSYDVNDCSACFGGIVGGNNMGGAVVSPITFNNNQTLPIGQNYLYNMIYNGIYFITTVSSSPCALPGCSWPGDSPAVRGWCLSINVASSHSSYTHSDYKNGTNPPANVPPYSAAASSIAFNYNYELINPSTLGVGNTCIGPVTCNDKTLTCKVSTTQNESFRPY